MLGENGELLNKMNKESRESDFKNRKINLLSTNYHNTNSLPQKEKDRSRNAKE